MAHYDHPEHGGDAPAYGFGAELPVNRWLALDVGYMGLGEVTTGNYPREGTPGYGLGGTGLKVGAQRWHIIPTLRVPAGRFEASLGAGIALAQTRSVPYLPWSAGRVFDLHRAHSGTDWIAKAALRWSFTDAIAIELAGLHGSLEGYRGVFRIGRGVDIEQYQFDATSATLGVSWSPGRRRGGEPPWQTGGVPSSGEAAGRLPMRGYVRAGVALYDLMPADQATGAYGLGAEFPLGRWVSLDLGYLDLGEAKTGSFPTIGIPEYGGADFGVKMSAHLLHVIPTLRVPVGRLEFALGVGGGWAETRSRTYHALTANGKIVAATRTHGEAEWVGRAGVSWKVTDVAALELGAYHVGLQGYNWGPYRDSERFDVTAFTLGLSVSSDIRPGSGESAWRFCAGPAISHLSFHANYKDTALGYDLALRRRVGRHWTVEVGHMESGRAKARPLYEDGSPLRTPPFDIDEGVDFFGDPIPWDPDLLVRSGTTYALVGAESPRSKRWSVGLAAGAGWTKASFTSAHWVSGWLPYERYIEVVARPTLLAQARASWRIGADWRVDLAVRYTEYEGVQITFPYFEPDFGNTKVRMWSVSPQLSMAF